MQPPAWAQAAGVVIGAGQRAKICSSPSSHRPLLVLAGPYRLPTGKERQAFIRMKGRLLLQLIQSHFNLFYLGMGDRKGKKESLPTTLQKAYVNSPILNDLARYQVIATPGAFQE